MTKINSAKNKQNANKHMKEKPMTRNNLSPAQWNHYGRTKSLGFLLKKKWNNWELVIVRHQVLVLRDENTDINTQFREDKDLYM